MDRNSLISAPINFPIVQPDDWEKWWNLWYKEASVVPKVKANHNLTTYASWRGFDIYVKDGVDSLRYGYLAKNLNCPDMFSSLFGNLNSFPIDIYVMRALSSTANVYPHSDSSKPTTGIRTLLYDNNVRHNFYYVFRDKKVYQTLPTDTNTWMYNDHKSKHGTDFYPGHSKILIAYYGKIKDDVLDNNLKENLEKYNNYVVYDR